MESHSGTLFESFRHVALLLCNTSVTPSPFLASGRQHGLRPILSARLPRIWLADSADLGTNRSTDSVVGGLAILRRGNFVYMPVSEHIGLCIQIEMRSACIIGNTIASRSDDGQPSEHTGSRGPDRLISYRGSGIELELPQSIALQI